ncbi:MAG: DUF2959 domain-containing protein [Gammaproteobacteria bacterium]|nr:DUF2959 domain-containing protein [Gammaproteobacteria bacterium]
MPKILAALLPLLLKKRSWLLIVVVAWLALSGSGMSLPSMDSMTDISIDRLWKEPRELLVDRVEDARDMQQETIEEFQTAMEKFKAVTGFQGGELEAQYEKLNTAYERSADRAAAIGEKVDKVTLAANALLDEWRVELKDYHDERMRRMAEIKFDQTRAHAGRLIASMRAVETRTKPVLALFRDQVLFLKHNLNARAISSLDSERVRIEGDVTTLIADMQAAIDEADRFIEALKVQT